VAPRVNTTFYLTETNSTTGCSKKDSVKITVNPKPVVDISGPVTTCQGTGYIYKSPSITTANYSWNVTGGTMNAFPTPDSIEVIWTSATGEVSLTVTSNEGCSNTFKVAVTANAPPTAAFSATTVCLGGTTIFTNSSTGANAAVWNFGDGSPTSTTTSPGHKYATAGKYTVILLTRNASGCIDTISHEVTVNALPSATFKTTKVSGNVYNFAANNTTATTYAWNFGDGNTASTATTSHTYATAGQYKVTLNVKDGNGCDSQEEDTTLSVTVGIGEVDPLNGSLNVYPNPFNHSLTVAYTLPKQAEVKVTLMDVTGRVMSEMPARTEAAGKYQYELPVSADLKPGMYMLRITTDNVPVTRTLMKL
jgi:PKD repeat protein